MYYLHKKPKYNLSCVIFTLECKLLFWLNNSNSKPKSYVDYFSIIFEKSHISIVFEIYENIQNKLYLNCIIIVREKKRLRFS